MHRAISVPLSGLLDDSHLSFGGHNAFVEACAQQYHLLAGLHAGSSRGAGRSSGDRLTQLVVEKT